MLEKKVDLEQIYKLNDEIKISKAKIEELQKEEKYLSKIEKEHENCKINQEKIEKEIDDIKTQINELRNENKKKSFS